MKKAPDKEPLHTLRSSATILKKQLSCQLVIINQIFVRPSGQQALRLYLLRNLHKAGVHIGSGSIWLLCKIVPNFSVMDFPYRPVNFL
jgi:hypothetical protein